VHPTTGAGAGLVDVPGTAESVVAHFRNTLSYIQGRKQGLSHGGEEGGAGETARLFESVEVAGALLKIGA